MERSARPATANRGTHYKESTLRPTANVEHATNTVPAATNGPPETYQMRNVQRPTRRRTSPPLNATWPVNSPTARRLVHTTSLRTPRRVTRSTRQPHVRRLECQMNRNTQRHNMINRPALTRRTIRAHRLEAQLTHHLVTLTNSLTQPLPPRRLVHSALKITPTRHYPATVHAPYTCTNGAGARAAAKATHKP